MIPRRRDMMGAMRRSSVMSALAAMGAEGQQQSPGLEESLSNLYRNNGVASTRDLTVMGYA
jgi:hypothetical protein